MSYQPRHPAAFINAISEEGTKEEAIEWLWRQWDETCDLTKQRDRLVKALESHSVYCHDQLKHKDPWDECYEGWCDFARAILAEIEKTGK